MFKSKIQGNPDSALNCYRRKFNNKPFFHRMRTHLKVAFIIKVMDFKYIKNKILIEGCKAGLGGGSASD